LPRFTIGDRVQLVGDIARFYTCVAGVILNDDAYPASVLNQYRVRLADGTVGTFFDFQLQSPPTVTAHVILDTSVAPKSAGTRGGPAARQIRLLARDIDIHLHISGAAKKTIVGQIVTGTAIMRRALVTVLLGDQAADSTATDDSGEFTLRDVAPGKVTIEIIIPGRRIHAAVTL
jgi:hypothetical protein